MDKEDVVHTHNGKPPRHKNEWNNAICSDIDEIILSEVSQKEKDKCYMVSVMWNLKYDTNEPICEIDSQSTDLWLPRGRKQGEGWSGRLGSSDTKLLHTEWVNTKVLMYRTENYIFNTL